MKTKPYVTVIVPVYKVEKYLDYCVQSLLNQTYEKYEIILVDDGSPDACPEMCDKYARDHGNITALHKNNGGLADARNFAVPYAKGDYIIFVDSDDYVFPMYIEHLVSLVLKYNTKIAVTSHKDVYNYQEQPSNTEKITEEKLNLITAYKRMLYAKGFGVSTWAKIYTKDLVEKYPYPYGYISEDLATTYKMFSECDFIAASNVAEYCYVQRSDSIMHRKLQKEDITAIKAAKEQLEFISQHYPEARNAAIYRLAFRAMEFIPRIINESNKKMFLYLQETIKPYLWGLLKDKNVGAGAKVKIALLCLGYEPTKFYWEHH